MWNGNTTLEWSQQCKDMMENWEKYAKRNVITTECISKYDLLLKIKDVYGGNVIRVDKDDRPMSNKCLIGTSRGTIFNQLKELKEFYGY